MLDWLNSLSQGELVGLLCVFLLWVAWEIPSAGGIERELREIKSELHKLRRGEKY